MIGFAFAQHQVVLAVQDKHRRAAARTVLLQAVCDDS
jgi:hypothetical protein